MWSRRAGILAQQRELRYLQLLQVILIKAMLYLLRLVLSSLRLRRGSTTLDTTCQQRRELRSVRPSKEDITLASREGTSQPPLANAYPWRSGASTTPELKVAIYPPLRVQKLAQPLAVGITQAILSQQLQERGFQQR